MAKKKMDETSQDQTAAPVEEKKVRTRAYYCHQAILRFPVPVLDDDGKPEIRRDASGNKMRHGADFEMVTEYKQFTTISTRPDHELSIYMVYETTPDHVMQALERLRADKKMRVYTEDEHRRIENPMAAVAQLRVRELEDERDGLFNQLHSEKSGREALEEELAALKQKYGV